MNRPVSHSLLASRNFLIKNQSINAYGIVLLRSASSSVEVQELKNYVRLVNKDNSNSVQLKLQTITVEHGTLLSSEVLYGTKNKEKLSSANFILELHQVDPMACVLSELLNIPHITLEYGSSVQCKNTFVLRPDLDQLNTAVITMIKEDKPKVVAVITEDGLGDVATTIMAHDQLINRLSFHVIAVVDFTNSKSIKKAVRDLKDSSIRKVLLVAQSRHLKPFLEEVREGTSDSENYRWYTPVAESLDIARKQVYDGIMQLSLPIDEERLKSANDSLRILPFPKAKSQVFRPHLYDVFKTIAEVIKKHLDLDQRCDQTTINNDNGLLCPKSRSQGRPIASGNGCKTLVDSMKKVDFRGITGPIVFTKQRYRNISTMYVEEISKGQNVPLGRWSVDCEAFRWNPNTTYAKEKRKMWQQCGKEEEEITTFKPRKRNLRVVTYVESPFVIEEGNNTNKYIGFCQELLDKLATDLDFTYQIYQVPQGQSYGTLNLNGTWNGMVGQLIDKEADLALAALTITADREGVIDFSKPFMDFTMSLILEKPTKNDYDLFAFLKPFHETLWLSILGVTFAMTLFMYIIDRYSPDGYRNLAETGEGGDEIQGNEFKLHNCLWFATASMLQQGPDQTPRSGSGRVLSASFWFFILIIISTYTANLAAFFTTTTVTNTIKSLDDLANQDKIQYGVGYGGQTYNFFKTSFIPLHKKMFSTMERKNSFAKNTKSAVARVRKGGYAYLTDDPILNYANKRKPCNTMLLRNLLQSQSYGLGLQQNSEWTNPISVKILNLRESGFIERLRMKWWDEKSECVASKASATPVSLEFKSMAGVFIVLLGGIGVAFVLLCIEMKCKAWIRACCYTNGKMPATDNKQVLKPRQITYLDYKSNCDNFDVAFTKEGEVLVKVRERQNPAFEGSKEGVYGSSYCDKDRQYQPSDLYRDYKDAPESTL